MESMPQHDRNEGGLVFMRTTTSLKSPFFVFAFGKNYVYLLFRPHADTKTITNILHGNQYNRLCF